MPEGDSIQSKRRDESKESEPAYAKVARRAVFENCGAVRLRTGYRFYFFSETADVMAARLLARGFGQCAEVTRRCEVDAIVATVSATSTDIVLDNDVVDCTDTITERRGQQSPKAQRSWMTR